MTLTSGDLLFAAGGDVWEKYGTFVKRTLPEEERGTFSRSSDATYTDRSGNLRTAESGVLRPHYVSSESSYSARLEAARTNELHNSDSPATQTRNLTAGTYTLWMEGSGSVDASGATDGSYGTATEGQSNDLTFTVSAQQDVTFTVNNTVTRFQCEEGSFRSSFITTASSAVSRAADDLTFPISFGPQALTTYQKTVIRSDTTFPFRWHWVGATDGSKTRLVTYTTDFGGARCQLDVADGTQSQASVSYSISVGDVVETRSVIKPDWSVAMGIAVNGGAENVGTGSGASAPSSWSGQEIAINSDAGGGNKVGFANYLSGPLIAPGVRTMDEMRSIEV